MECLTNRILLLGKETEELNLLESLLDCLPYQVAIASSEEQAVSLSGQNPPCLVILAGNACSWSPALVNQLRQQAKICGVTIVALTDCHAPNWFPQESDPGVDGYLVKPLGADILVSLVESAKWKQFCCFQKV